MNVEEFRSKIKAGIELFVNGEEFFIKEVVKFKFDDDSYYIKCFLNDDYVLADDLAENMYVLVKEVKTSFKPEFPKNLKYNKKDFKFSYNAHAVAEETWGEEIFKKGDGEQFWDYKAEDGSYLSLGIIDNTNERLDFFGEIIVPNNVYIKE